MLEQPDDNDNYHALDRSIPAIAENSEVISKLSCPSSCLQVCPRTLNYISQKRSVAELLLDSGEEELRGQEGRAAE